MPVFCAFSTCVQRIFPSFVGLADWCLVVRPWNPIRSAGRESCHLLHQAHGLGDYRVHRVRVDKGQGRRPARRPGRLRHRPRGLVHRRRLCQCLRDGELYCGVLWFGLRRKVYACLCVLGGGGAVRRGILGVEFDRVTTCNIGSPFPTSPSCPADCWYPHALLL